jgi:stage II sporulation protein E
VSKFAGVKAIGFYFTNYYFRWRWKLKGATVRTRGKVFDLAKNYSLKLLFVKAMYFISGILMSRGAIFGSYYPFGVSLSAVVPGKLIAPTVIGAALGYLFPMRLGSGIRYISTIISITAVRWTLSDLPKVRNHFLYTPIIVFLSSLVTGVAMISAEGFDGRSFFISVLEALIAAAAAYFFDNTFKILSKKKMYALNHKEFACVAISFSIMLLSLAEVSVVGVSLGRVLAVVMVLTAAYSMGVAGGGISGIASGVIFSLPSFGFTYISGSYAFGGMIAGFFSSFGRIGVCTAFIFVNTFLSFQSGDVSVMVSGVYESVLAVTVFLLLPKSFFNKVKYSSPSFLTTSESNAAKEAVVQRLGFASKSFLSVPDFIEKASLDFFKAPKLNLHRLRFLWTLLALLV